MNDHFKNYYWKNGKPYGKHKASMEDALTYRVVADPYYKRITLEKYKDGKFLNIVYDSLLLDFRHLRIPEQQAWLREIQYEDVERTTCLIRNQDDRAILIESLQFENNRCRTCQISSIHGIPISIHRMYYKSMNDPFDGVILFDMEERPVMKKTYETDLETGEFTNLIAEEWQL